MALVTAPMFAQPRKLDAVLVAAHTTLQRNVLLTDSNAHTATAHIWGMVSVFQKEIGQPGTMTNVQGSSERYFERQETSITQTNQDQPGYLPMIIPMPTFLQGSAENVGDTSRGIAHLPYHILTITPTAVIFHI